MMTRNKMMEATRAGCTGSAVTLSGETSQVMLPPDAFCQTF